MIKNGVNFNQYNSCERLNIQNSCQIEIINYLSMIWIQYEQLIKRKQIMGLNTTQWLQVNT